LLTLRVTATNHSRPQIAAEVFFVQSYDPHIWQHTWSLIVEEMFLSRVAAPARDRNFPVCGGDGLVPFGFTRTDAIAFILVAPSGNLCCDHRAGFDWPLAASSKWD